MKYLAKLRERRAAALAAIREVSDAAAEAGRSLTDDEDAQIRALDEEVTRLDGDITVHQRIEERAEAARAADEAASAAMRDAEPDPGAGTAAAPAAEARRGSETDSAGTLIRVGGEPLVYGPGSGSDHLLDVYRSSMSPDGGTRAAAGERMSSHARQMADTDEAVRISKTDEWGADGGLLPPAYITSMIAELPRDGRPFVDLIPKTTMPSRGLKVNLPQEAATGEVAGHAENADVQIAAAAGTDIITDEEIEIVQVAGRWTTTRKALDRGEGVSDLIWRSLAARYDEKFNQSLYTGRGSAHEEVVGILTDAATTSVVWTDTTPTFAEFWPKWRQAVGDLWKARKRRPTLACWSPGLWTWVSSQLDTTNRPMTGTAMDLVRNPAALGESVGDFGIMASSQGLSILVDASVPENLGVGTNETAVVVTRPTDLILMESPTMSIRAEQHQVDKLLVDFVYYGYIAFSSGWQAKSSSKLTGTGMVLS